MLCPKTIVATVSQATGTMKTASADESRSTRKSAPAARTSAMTPSRSTSQSHACAKSASAQRVASQSNVARYLQDATGLSIKKIIRALKRRRAR